MLELFNSLALAAVGAVGWLAYRHPAGYRRLFPFLIAAVLLADAITVTWNLAAIRAFATIAPIVQRAEVAATGRALRAQTVEDWVFLLPVAAVVYLTLLRFLNHVIQDSDERPHR